MKTDDLLIEIFSEELPPCALNALSQAFLHSITQQLAEAELPFSHSQAFATPRRLALLISGLQFKQADKTLSKRGPSIDKAYDAKGQPTKACLGFATACNVNVETLQTQKTEQGEWVFCKMKQLGKTIDDLIPGMIQAAIKTLPIPKWMRWGDHADSFARPVHSVILLYGNKIIDATILGHKTGNITQGHRFLCNKPIRIKCATSYEKQLKKTGFVIANFEERKTLIEQQITAIAKKNHYHAMIEEDLLSEVTGLVEWPTAMYAGFNKAFLDVPRESLISAIEDHQKSFALEDDAGTLQAGFIFVSNLTDAAAKTIIAGNEKVMSARLSDAEFFYHNDCKIKLIERLNSLKHVIYQEGLGSLHDKAKRLEALCAYLSKNNDTAKRAGLLAKTDLITNMVFEFPELQGTMGYYYALHDGETPELALALKEQYCPKSASDDVPRSAFGVPLSLADKLDTLVGHFGLNQLPTGNKDPFALRRCALGIIRTIIENQLSFDLETLLQFAIDTYQVSLENKNTRQQLFAFFNDRLRIWCKDQGFSLDIVDSVLALNLTDIFDIYKRIEAVKEFKTLSEASALAAANKRVSNILNKEKSSIATTVNTDLFEKDIEHKLYQQISDQKKLANNNYAMTLKNFATLDASVNQFFDEVLVNANDEKIKNNRLALLNNLRHLFLQVADIALLQ